MPKVDKECTTHHNACDCREAKFAAILAYVKRLHNAGLVSTMSVADGCALDYQEVTEWLKDAPPEVRTLQAENKRLRELESLLNWAQANEVIIQFDPDAVVRWDNQSIMCAGLAMALQSAKKIKEQAQKGECDEN